MHVLLRMVVAPAIVAGVAAAAYGQKNVPEIEKKLILLMQTADTTQNFDKKCELYDDFTRLLESNLNDTEIEEYLFDSIPNVSAVASKDKNMIIYSWMIPSREKKAKYGCIIYHKPASSRKYDSKVFVMNDVKDKIKSPDIALIKYPDWFGCIYYDLVEKQDGDKTVYTLIGFDVNDSISHRKYIDILSFDKDNSPIFGLPAFLDDRSGLKSRIIFEYTSQSVMMARYFREFDKIVFNYLYPIIPEKADDRSYYVPDVTYDGYEYKYGKWLKVKNIPLRKADDEVQHQSSQKNVIHNGG